MISATSAASVVPPSSAATVGPTRSSTQRKRQRLDQLVGRIAHLVGSAPSRSFSVKNLISHNNNNNDDEDDVLVVTQRNHNHHSNNNNLSGEEERVGSLSDEELDMAESSNGESSPSPVNVHHLLHQQHAHHLLQHHQSVIMSRLRMRGGHLRHLHLPGHHLHQHHPQVFSFDHLATAATASDDEGEEEVFSPGLTAPAYSDRLTLSPCSQSSCTVESPSCISFSPLSFSLPDAEESAAKGVARSLASDPSTPLNLSKSSAQPAGFTPPHASSSPRSATLNVDGNRRRARSDSELRDSTALPSSVSESAAPASWVLTPASSISLMTPPEQPSGGHQSSPPSTSVSPRMSRLEHLRPPPLMVSLKRNSSDSVCSDGWSPLGFSQQESPVDLSVRSGGSVSSDSPNQTNGSTYSYNTSTASSSELSSSAYSSAGFDTPPPSASHRVGKSRGPGGSRFKALTRSISLSQYLTLSAEYSPSMLELAMPPLSAGLIGAESIKPPGFGCEVCGQVFDHHDRLVKHMASRHKTPPPAAQQQRPSPPAAGVPATAEPGAVVKGYQCDVCQRPFARSDMLTRHMRLHTGLKPYTCRICGQVFSRSDHLSTHQRTHTGEKPYRCPQCSYAACRRDMITRHLRTHTRSEDLDGLSAKDSG